MDATPSTKKPKIDKALSKENWRMRKDELRKLIIETVTVNGSFVDYSFLMRTTKTPFFPLVTLLKYIALDDIKNNRPTADSLVTRKGTFIPPDAHFLLREKTGHLLSGTDWSAYHDEMIKKWCSELNLNYNLFKNTVPYGYMPPVTKSQKPTRREETSKKVNKYGPIGDRIAPEVKAQVLEAFKQPKGMFSMRELMRMR